MERRECEDKRSEPSVSDPRFEARLSYHFRLPADPHDLKRIQDTDLAGVPHGSVIEPSEIPLDERP